MTLLCRHISKLYGYMTFFEYHVNYFAVEEMSQHVTSTTYQKNKQKTTTT